MKYPAPGFDINKKSPLLSDSYMGKFKQFTAK